MSLNYARKMRYILQNPIEEVELPQRDKFVGNFYSQDKVNNLIEVAKDTKFETAILFAAFYGLRRSECSGLKWSDIDFENNTVLINHSIVSTYIEGV